MKLITKAIMAKLVANGESDLAAILDDGNTEDFKPVLKLFNPCGAATWLITSIDEDGDRMFGLCDLGMGSPELGYVSLAEVEAIRLPFGLTIERDMNWKATRTIREYASEARNAGHISA